VPRLSLVLALVLAACAAPQAGYRDTAVPMFSAALLDPARLPGAWDEAAAFGGGSCPGGGVTIGADLSVTGRLCLGGTPATISGRLTPSGPGRFEVAGTGAWWVLWVDSGYRTLAIGTPDGTWGVVLDRDGGLPEDRYRAAAELFDFNGYRAGELARVP
jgi:apolipoprotein D and lipocalin family protein